MATSGDINVKPDHVIIWLDKNMGVSKNNQSSKKVLADNADVDGLPVDQDARDIDNFICSIDLELIEEQWDDLIRNPLRMFTDRNECIKCINDNIVAGKQPFLITSGQMGALIVPLVHDILRGHIYIFCGQRDVHQGWTQLYHNDIEIYDDEKGVFAKVLADIGIHYLLKGQEEMENQTSAIQYFHWARRLFIRAGKLDCNERIDFLKCVDDELTKLQSSQTNAGDDTIGQDARDA